MHVDEFIGDFNGDAYARWFFMLHRLPAILQTSFGEWICQYRLFCTYEDERFRVTGCSRLGDVWLARDFARDTGYDLRVDVEQCSRWSAAEGKEGA